MVFKIYGDGKRLGDSGVMRPGQAAKPVDVDLGGVKTLLLLVDDAGDGIAFHHADGAEARFVVGGCRPGHPFLFRIPTTWALSAIAQTAGLKRETIRAVVPLRVGTNTAAQGTVSSAYSTTAAIASAPVPGFCCTHGARRSLSRAWGRPRFGGLGDLGQHRHRFLGVFAHRRFGREHQAIGPVQDRVGDIGGLGPRRQPARHHGLQHLGRADAEVNPRQIHLFARPQFAAHGHSALHLGAGDALHLKPHQPVVQEQQVPRLDHLW